MKHLFLALCGLCAAAPAALAQGVATPNQGTVAQAQNIKITGTVVDENGETMPGVAVAIKGTTNGTVTDFDGNFTLNAPANGTIVVTFVGYQNIEMNIEGRASLGTLKLVPEFTELDQVVVVGYGVQKKADLTGSVAIVNAEEMKRTSNSNISTLLEGKVAGVQITSDGQPGADPAVRIRGIGSFGSTAPLYVIDGVPMGTTIRDFSPNDIETIQVLKDASAGAIYGSRAANGVVIITTKRGSKDKPAQISYSGYVGMDIIDKNVYDVMDADQYSAYIGQACENANISVPGGYKLNADGKYQFQDNTNTDWFDEVFKTGVRQNHNVNISGGGQTNTYNLALDYFDQTGTLEGAGPNYTRYTARLNNTMDVKFIKVKTGVVYSHSDQDNMGLSNASEYVQGLYGDVTNVLRGTLLMQPTIKAYDQSTWVLDDKVGAAKDWKYDAHGYGVYYDNVHGDISASNPLLVNNLLTRNTVVDRIVATGSADADLLEAIGLKNDNHSLHYNINLSYSKTYVKNYTWIGAWLQSNRVYLSKANEKLTQQYSTTTDALIENTIMYDGKFGGNHINLVVGQTFEKEMYHTLTGWGTNFTEPYFLQINNAKERDASSYESKHVLASYIGRLNYDYNEKYLVSLTARYDGSSRLSSDDRWEVFPSVSLGWRLDREDFFPVDPDVINLLKIRGSYGVLGNENIGEYQYQTTMNRNNMTYSFNGSPITGSAISNFVNNEIAWEKKKSTNVGIDVAMFNNRFEFSAEYYKNVSEDLLYSVPVPTSAGVANETVTMNAASMENSGLEFSATYRNRDHAVKYEVSANLSTLKNKVTSLGFGTDSYITGAYATYVGEEIGQFYGWEYEGIFRTQKDLDSHATQVGANVGDCMYRDQNNDGVIDDKDQVVLGSGLPAANFGLSARVEWKGFDLAVSTFGALGYKVSDDIYNSLNSCYGWGNRDVAMAGANQWDGATYVSNVPRTYVSNGDGQYMWNDLFSERKIQDADYWKISNIELGYNFSDSMFNDIVNGVRLYVSAQNVATITGYKGYNVDYAGGTFTPGYNFCSFPTPRTFMAGLRFSF